MKLNWKFSSTLCAEEAAEEVDALVAWFEFSETRRKDVLSVRGRVVREKIELDFRAGLNPLDPTRPATETSFNDRQRTICLARGFTFFLNHRNYYWRWRLRGKNAEALWPENCYYANSSTVNHQRNCPKFFRPALFVICGFIAWVFDVFVQVPYFLEEQWTLWTLGCTVSRHEFELYVPGHDVKSLPELIGVLDWQWIEDVQVDDCDRFKTSVDECVFLTLLYILLIVTLSWQIWWMFYF